MCYMHFNPKKSSTHTLCKCDFSNVLEWLEKTCPKQLILNSLGPSSSSNCLVKTSKVETYIKKSLYWFTHLKAFWFCIRRHRKGPSIVKGHDWTPSHNFHMLEICSNLSHCTFSWCCVRNIYYLKWSNEIFILFLFDVLLIMITEGTHCETAECCNRNSPMCLKVLEDFVVQYQVTSTLQLLVCVCVHNETWRRSCWMHCSFWKRFDHNNSEKCTRMWMDCCDNHSYQ